MGNKYVFLLSVFVLINSECFKNGNAKLGRSYLVGRIKALELEFKAMQLEFSALGLRYHQLYNKFESMESHTGGDPSSLNTGEWSEWGECDVTCGGGFQTRYSSFMETQISEEGRECRGSSEESRNCNIQPCTNAGATFTRWGRTTCPVNGSEIVYTGYVAGGHYTHKGSGSEYLCLPADPETDETFLPVITGYQNYLYGTEYEIQHDAESISLFGNPLQNHNVPCALCQSLRHSTVLMIPGRSKCYDGWTMEYNGYLMSGYYNHEASKPFKCVDSKAEQLPGGESNEDGALFYPVTTQCGSMPCPPYIGGRAVPCSVCTK